MKKCIFAHEVTGKPLFVSFARFPVGCVGSNRGGLVSYVLGQDVTLNDGETIGFSAEQKLPITRSEGVSLPGMTLKIGYGAE